MKELFLEVLMAGIKLILSMAFYGAIDRCLGITQFINNVIDNFHIMNNLWVNWGIIIGFGTIITFILEKKGFYKWGYNSFLRIRFLPLQEAIDYIKEYNVEQSQALNTLRISLNINSQNERDINFSKNVIGQSLASIIGYAIDDEITIYGQKSFSISKLQPISFKDIHYQPWLYREHWSNDYSSVYKDHKKDRQDLLYTNLQVKKADLQKLVQKYKFVRKKTNL